MTEHDTTTVVEVSAPTEPGFYIYDGGRQTMVFLLDAVGQWRVWGDLQSDRVEKCEWGYIEQALSVWNLVRLDAAVPA